MDTDTRTRIECTNWDEAGGPRSCVAVEFHAETKGGRTRRSASLPQALRGDKAAWPFIAGAVGGLFAGCTVGGIGPNFFGA